MVSHIAYPSSPTTEMHCYKYSRDSCNTDVTTCSEGVSFLFQNVGPTSYLAAFGGQIHIRYLLLYIFIVVFPSRYTPWFTRWATCPAPAFRNSDSAGGCPISPPGFGSCHHRNMRRSSAQVALVVPRRLIMNCLLLWCSMYDIYTLIRISPVFRKAALSHPWPLMPTGKLFLRDQSSESISSFFFYERIHFSCIHPSFPHLFRIGPGFIFVLRLIDI